jgi:hypothetical protein
MHSNHPELLEHLVLKTSDSNNAIVLELVHFLGCDELSEGTYMCWRTEIFRAFILARGFLGSLRSNVDNFNDRQRTALALLLLHTSTEEIVRNSVDAKHIAKCLIQGSIQGASHLALRFAEVCSGETSVRDVMKHESSQSTQGAKAIMRPPGVRNHDNDKKDYRSIRIVPTVSELQDWEAPFLPSEDDVSGIDIEVSGRAAAQVTYLDRLFRLTREDMLGPLREELREELQPAHGTPRRQQRLHQEPRLVSVDPDRGLEFEISVPMPQALAGRLSKMKHKEKKDFMEDGPGRRVLSTESLVVFLNCERAVSKQQKGKSQTMTTEPPKIMVIGVGVVVRRDNILGTKQTNEQGSLTCCIVL